MSVSIITSKLDKAGTCMPMHYKISLDTGSLAQYLRLYQCAVIAVFHRHTHELGYCNSVKREWVNRLCLMAMPAMLVGDSVL